MASEMNSPMRLARLVLSILASVVLAACAHATAPASPRAALTILVSIDGFRADYFGRGPTPTLAALAADGVRSRGMRPSFPSLTYPNHYTLVTGLRPDRHGIVDNVMYDPARPGVRFALSDRAVIADPFWWDAATPIWVSAERQGIRTGGMFWPGADFAIHGVRPSQWRTYDMAVPPDQRVDTVLGWLDQPAVQRPRLVALYLDDVDEAGHLHGPASPEVDAALARVDAALGRLVAGLKARGLDASTDIVIVADHGMAATSPQRVVFFDDLVDPAAIHLVSTGPVASLAPVQGREAEVDRALIGRHGAMRCWRKGDLPVRFHYGANPRVQPIVCLADVGWVMLARAGFNRAGFNLGRHGYDPEAPEMAALFIAHGPSFRSGVLLPAFDNVDVYPLVAKVVGVTPEPGDGRLSRIAAALRP